MASNTPSFPRMFKLLREDGNIKEKREALTYIRCNSKKLESSNAIKEEQYREICKVVVETFANGNGDIQNEAYETLNVIIRDFKEHSLNLFEAISQINRKNRLKILKLLEVVEETALSTMIYDPSAMNFLKDCIRNVQPLIMTWLAPTACTNNLQALIEAESEPLSDDEKLEEETIIYSVTLLRRLYKVAAIMSDDKIEMFDALLMDKIMLLAYMGHKRQRGPALKLLQQSLATNILSNVRTKLSDVWAEYKTTLQSTYCKRMLLLVSACELDWATQWNISIEFLGVDLHRGASLINNLLSVEEKAFKSTDTIIRRQAFLSWKLLVDNFALDPQELATSRRIKLLCIPLNAKNSKTELIAVTKLEVWWHVIIRLYKDISKFVTPLIVQFLNFCFGPLGDTPLLSSKFDVMASPGKRFFKTKVVAIDALLQLLVKKHDNHTVFSPILEERLPHPMHDNVFQECYKSVIHSVGEALLILSQLTDSEMKNRYQFGKVLWINLINYVQESKMKAKELMYKDMVLVITALLHHAVQKPMIKDLIFNEILFEITELSANFNCQDKTLSELVLKLLQSSMFDEAEKAHYNALKSLLWQSIKPNEGTEYHAHTLKIFKQFSEKLYSLPNVNHTQMIVLFELWCILAEMLTKYMKDSQKISEGDNAENNFKDIESILIFPLKSVFLQDQEKIQQLANVWKTLYAQFESQMDLVQNIKPNEVLLKVASTMQECFSKNKECCGLIANCLDVLLSNINYKYLLESNDVPSILQLLIDLITYSSHNTKNFECETALRALSALLITVYGHDSQKIIAYLQTCKPAIESVLTSKSEALFKEMANMWETIISIFKGLNKSIDYNFLSSYKEIILQALNHSNPYIESQRFAICKIENISDDKVKSLFEEIEKQARKSLESKKRKDKSLNKNSERSTETIKETKTKKEAVPVESDSQGYVTIKTDLKFDVNRLTEHQKESLKRRREDIPALYNDLSQSSSQDTQNLQEWFDKSSKRLEESDKTRTKKNDVFIEDISDSDANKENNIDATETEVTGKPVVNDIETKLSEQIAEPNVSLETSQSLKPGIGEPEKIDEEETNITETQESNLINAASLNEKAARITMSDSFEDIETSSIDKEMNCELQEEFPENKSREQQSSPSILDNGKRRSRNNNIRGSSSGLSRSREIFDDTSKQSDSMNVNQRTLRTKIVQGKSNTTTAPKTLENIKQKVFNDGRRGVKRKSSSDSESEGIRQRRKRRATLSAETSGNDTNDKSVASDSPTADMVGENESLSRRTKNEMSRLRINMVFNCPLPNRRRSKVHEENYKETNTKRTTSDNKGAKLKVEKVVRNVDKEEKVTASQCITTRRSKRITKFETDKADEYYEGRSTSEQGKDNDTREKNASSQKNPLVITTIPKNSKRNETDDRESSNNNMTTNSEDEESGTEIQAKEIDPKECDGKEHLLSSSENDSPELDEVEDIIENSQESVSKLEKQCFIKINKIQGIHTTKSQDLLDEDEETEEIISDSNNDDGKDCEKVEEVNVSRTSPSLNVASSPEAENNQHDDEKYVASEAQKNNDTSSAIKFLIECSSPKGSSKRYTKFKPYTAQGRAAHMLGLVTKQGKIEADGQVITIDDESTNKKAKGKDTDNEAAFGKKERSSTLKDVDKVSRSCSSRQEKIFSNMRSIDYCSTPTTKLFPNLRNDGEKVSPRNEKSIESATPDSDSFVDVVNEGNTTPPLDKDELPILEWSSANPPSLTASPSASILKRHRLSMPESEPESTTPNKRKRVSFADPPVSKEMGYEIAATESPHKLNKSSSVRGSLSRKDSPLRFKQTRLRIMQSNPEKAEREEDMQAGSTSEIDLQCERENELLTKIAEELEFSENMIVDVDTQPPCNLMENESINDSVNEADECNKVTIDNISAEIEITQSFAPSRNVDVEVTEEMDRDNEQEKSDNSNDKKDIESDDCKTQEDIFCGINDEYDNVQRNSVNNELNSDHNCSVENSTIDSVKFDTTADSVMDNSVANHSAGLEDTVDVGNCTGLNITADSDEIFCDKFIRSSTHATENAEEQDTLPVTDSMFGSLPLSQDSHDTSDFNMEVSHPELLDSNEPIYPTLTSCQESINSIIEKLTNPLWVQHLSVYFVNRGLQSVGDLAKLSEREVNRIPVKSNSKVNFVRSILKSFESTYCGKVVENQPQELKNVKSEVDDSMDVDVCSSVPITMTDDDSSSVTYETKIKSLNHDSPIIRPDGSLPFHNDVESNSNCVDARDEISRQSPSEECDMEKIINSTVGASASELSSKMSIATKSNLVSSMMLNMPGAKSTSSTSCTTKTVGTCTTSDSVYPLQTSKKVATKSVAAQMALEDLLDEIDVNLVLESAVRRCTADKILLQYKNKMRHIPQAELEKQTIKMLGNQNRKNYSEVNLRSACRACGINKVLLRLPDIFSADKQFFVKVLNAYRKKIKTSDCLDILDFNEIKDVVYQKSTSSELAEMLSNKLKEEEQEGIKVPMTELSSLNAMLKRMPMDVIISHTVANDELIPSRVVLDIALQNNTPRDIARALESQAPLLTRNVFNKLWSSQFAVGYIKEAMDSNESLSDIFKAVSSKLSTEEFLQIYYECMKDKLKTAAANE